MLVIGQVPEVIQEFMSVGCRVGELFVVVQKVPGYRLLQGSLTAVRPVLVPGLGGYS
jgi:hypothetical protein